VDEISEKAHQVVERLLSLMELEATVETKPAENREAALNIKGDDLGILIGRYGQTLERLQYIVKLILSRQYQAEIGISIDVDGYQEQRCRSLESLAQRIAQKVKTTVRAITLKPMSAKERRLVHLVIAKDPELTSQSIGRGEFRRVVISPRRKGTR
jgi:spoIIIJ-associated protein